MLDAYKNLTTALVNLVNSPRGYNYEQYRQKVMLKPAQRQQFINTAVQLYQHRLVLTTIGELSLRLPSDQMVINSQNSHLGDLSETDLVVCSINPAKQNDSAPPNLVWHRQLYQSNSKAQAILLGQLPYATALANAQRLPDPQSCPALQPVVGEVAHLSDPATLPAMAHHPVLFIPQVGVLLWSDSLSALLSRAEAVEHMSQLTVIAGQLR